MSLGAKKTSPSPFGASAGFSSSTNTSFGGGGGTGEQGYGQRAVVLKTPFLTLSFLLDLREWQVTDGMMPTWTLGSTRTR
jgi:hypothetical protein